jgi:photosystem II stability/assembly factor-like uncharacterized protein
LNIRAFLLVRINNNAKLLMKIACTLSCVFTALLSFATTMVIAHDTSANRHNASEEFPLLEESLLIDIDHVDDLVVAVGDRGHILWTEDYRTWHQAEVPVNSTLTAIDMVNGKLGWAVGHDAAILATADAGRTWQIQHYAPEADTPLLDVWFDNKNRGIAIGAYGLYLVTEDGGQHWQQVEMQINEAVEPVNEQEQSEELIELYDLHLNAITESPDGTLYIVAEAGKVYRSKDRGKTWDELPSPYIGSLFGVLALENNIVLVYGLRGHLYRSDDAGMSWQRINLHTTNTITNGVRLHNNNIILTGMGGTLLMSYDSGHNFKPVITRERNSFAAAVETGDEQIITLGDKGIRNLSLQNLELIDE